jgi:hypothetical protein
MSERYWITGVQLGMLLFAADLRQKNLLKKIANKQFIGNDYSGKKKIVFEQTAKK